MSGVAHWALVGAGLLLAVGSVAGMSPNPHWALRAWDFPRAQIALAVLAIGAVYSWVWPPHDGPGWAFLAILGATAALQVRKVLPYTPFARRQVKRAERADSPRIRLLISNVKMENEQHELLLQRVAEADPDLVLAVETNQRWVNALEPLRERYPHVVSHPQENWYGLILFSRLPLVDAEVKFLVQDDIPSVHSGVELAEGCVVVLHGLHPRPPEPIRDQDSTPRDAELVVMAKRIRDVEHPPVVVAGDLNDVAWSPTSELFLRLSGLVDPRVGRGMYNSFHAGNPLFRYPLDHVFHSPEFRLVELRRLRSVGSDHFPMLVELAYEPEARAEQPPPEQKPGDEQEADDKLRRQAEAARTGDDRPRE